MSPFSKWCKERLFNGPFTVQPATDRGIIASKPLAQFGNAARDAADGHNPVVAPVSILADAGCPNAIENVVSRFVIHPFNAPAFLSTAHILKKVVKRIKPPLANKKVSTAVIFESFVVLVRATRFHVSPTNVRGALAVLRVPMSKHSRSGHLNPQTPTRFSLSSTKVAVRNNKFFPAITATTAVPVAFSGFSSRQNNKSSKSFADEVNSSRHNVRLSISDVVFSDACPARTGTHRDYGVMFKKVN